MDASIAVLEKAREVYSFRFFGIFPLEYIEIAASHCNKQGTTYCMNQEVPFIKQVLNDDVLFGNETEAMVLAETEEGAEKDAASIAKKLAALPTYGGDHARSRTHHRLRGGRGHKVYHHRTSQGEACRNQRSRQCVWERLLV